MSNILIKKINVLIIMYKKKENIADIIDLNKLHKMLDNINHKIKTRNNNSEDNICGYCFKEFSNKNN